MIVSFKILVMPEKKNIYIHIEGEKKMLIFEINDDYNLRITLGGMLKSLRNTATLLCHFIK